MSLKDCVLNRNGVIFYTLLNFIDKGINSCVPIAILFLYDKEIYSQVEFIISTSLLISSFFDFGIRSYAFYDYKQRKELAIINIRDALDTILLPQLFFYCIGLLVFPNMVTVAISLRAFFFSFQYVFTAYNRLIDSPSKSFSYSIPMNILLLSIALLVYVNRRMYSVECYMICYSIFTVGYIVRFLFAGRWKTKIINTFSYISNSLRFSWPIMLCLIGSLLIQNVVKIYGYDLISTDVYSNYAFTLRLFMLALLLHQSVIGFYQKEIFMCRSFPVQTFILYVICILAGLALVFLVWIVLPIISKFQFLPSFCFGILCLYYLLQCVRSFLESLLMKYYEVNKIALFTIISLIIFSTALMLLDITNIKNILIWQLIAEFVNVVLVVFSVSKSIAKK